MRRTAGEDGMQRLPQDAHEMQPAAAKQDASVAEEEICWGENGTRASAGEDACARAQLVSFGVPDRNRSMTSARAFLRFGTP
jgi:hypothetical protein